MKRYEWHHQGWSIRLTVREGSKTGSLVDPQGGEHVLHTLDHSRAGRGYLRNGEIVRFARHEIENRLQKVNYVKMFRSKKQRGENHEQALQN
jgi:hypothetical protein